MPENLPRMVPQSNSQLARSVLFNLPWFTLGFLVVQFVCFVLSGLTSTEASFFALQATDDSQLQSWGFDLSNPLRNAGLNLFSSFFIHSGWEHFLSNLTMSFLVLALAERSFGKRKILLFLVFGHLAGLLGAFVAHRVLAQASIAVGMSAGVFSVGSAVLKERLGRVSYAVSGLFACLYALMDLPGFTAHIFSILFGLTSKSNPSESLER